jgi:hypothetical protein
MNDSIQRLSQTFNPITDALPRRSATPDGDPIQRLAATYAPIDAPDEPDRGGGIAAKPPQDAVQRLAETYRQDPAEVPQSDDPAEPAEPDEPNEQVEVEVDEPDEADEADEPDEQQPVEVDPEVRRLYDETAQDLGVDDDDARALFDRMAPVIVQRQHQQAAELREQWAAQARADRELAAGGFEQNLAAANRVIDRFGDAELRKLLKQGLGDHPAMVRFAYRISRALDRAAAKSATRERTQS